MVGDILLDMLLHASEKERRLCAGRLATSRETPRRVLRYLSQCGIDIARPILEQSDSLDACELIEVIQIGTPEHRQTVANRRNLCRASVTAMRCASRPSRTLCASF